MLLLDLLPIFQKRRFVDDLLGLSDEIFVLAVARRDIDDVAGLFDEASHLAAGYRQFNETIGIPDTIALSYAVEMDEEVSLQDTKAYAYDYDADIVLISDEVHFEHRSELGFLYVYVTPPLEVAVAGPIQLLFDYRLDVQEARALDVLAAEPARDVYYDNHRVVWAVTEAQTPALVP